MTMKRCIVCSTPVISVTSNIDSYFFNCYQCGVFSIIDTAAADFADTFDREKRLLLSGWLRKNQEYTIQYNNFESLLKIRKPNIPDRANDLLLYISKICPDIGQSFNINLAFRTFVLFQDPKTEKLTEEDQKNGKLFVQMLSESWSKNWKELHWLINDYLILSNQYLKPVVVMIQ